MIINWSNENSEQSTRLNPTTLGWAWFSAPTQLIEIVGQGVFRSEISINGSFESKLDQNASFTSSVHQSGYFETEMEDLRELE